MGQEVAQLRAEVNSLQVTAMAAGEPSRRTDADSWRMHACMDATLMIMIMADPQCR